MNSLLERVDYCLSQHKGDLTTVARQTLEQCKAALSQQDAVCYVAGYVDQVCGSTAYVHVNKGQSIFAGQDVYTAPPSTAQESKHEWVDHGERCAKCGDKDWFAGLKCEGRIKPSQPTAQGVDVNNSPEVGDKQSCESKVSDKVPQSVEGFMKHLHECGYATLAITGYEKDKTPITQLVVRLDDFPKIMSGKFLDGGMVRVPVEPTDEMIDVACDASNLYRVDFIRAWDAAIIEAAKGE